MLGSSTLKYIIFTRSKIYIVDYASLQKSSKIFSIDYTPQTIKDALIQAKPHIKKYNAGVLLSDELVYVFCSKIKIVDEFGSSLDEEHLIKDKVKHKIPENITNLTWDYKCQTMNSEFKLFQVAAINSEIADRLSEFSQEDEVTIDFIEPISYALGRQTSDMPRMHVIVYFNEMENCILIADKGFVYYSSSFDAQDYEKTIKETVMFARNKYMPDSTDKIKVLISREKEDLALNDDALTPLAEFEYYNLDIFSGLGKKKEHHGKDEQVLNIVLNKEDGSKNIFAKVASIFKKSHSEIKPNAATGTSKARLYIMIAFLVVMMCVAVYLLLTMNKGNSAQTASPTQPKSVSTTDTTAKLAESPTPTSTPTAADDASKAADQIAGGSATLDTQAAADLKAVKIQALNGSGIPGEAGKVSDLIVKSGFNAPKTGNADAFDFTKTKVKIKSTVKPGTLKKLMESLSPYETELDSVRLDEAGAYDIEITVGKNKVKSSEAASSDQTDTQTQYAVDPSTKQ